MRGRVRFSEAPLLIATGAVKCSCVNTSVKETMFQASVDPRCLIPNILLLLFLVFVVPTLAHLSLFLRNGICLPCLPCLALLWGGPLLRQLNIASPSTGSQMFIEIDDEKKL